jgi:hypothetical protein
MRRIDSPLTTEGKNSKKKNSSRGKSFGYQVLGFGSGGAGSAFLVATGGSPACGAIVCTNYKVHTFTGDGTFCVTAGTCVANNAVSYMAVAGGGAGGAGSGGGGGAGGFRELSTPIAPYTASPLDGYPTAPNRVTVTTQGYPITVGAAGAGAPSNSTGGSGGNSVFSCITSAGGGGGGSYSAAPQSHGGDGGSGGGGGYVFPGAPGPHATPDDFKGVGNTPPTTPSQGNTGGKGYTNYQPGQLTNTGGGGGATAVGACGSGSGAGAGGAGATSSINATPTARAGGGGGGTAVNGTGASGGPGGGGAGGSLPAGAGTVGTTNTGGGAGGNSDKPGPDGVNGGSGIVYIRYKFQ